MVLPCPWRLALRTELKAGVYTETVRAVSLRAVLASHPETRIDLLKVRARVCGNVSARAPYTCMGGAVVGELRGDVRARESVRASLAQ
jgi:hypothetical protein